MKDLLTSASTWEWAWKLAVLAVGALYGAGKLKNATVARNAILLSIGNLAHAKTERWKTEHGRVLSADEVEAYYLHTCQELMYDRKANAEKAGSPVRLRLSVADEVVLMAVAAARSKALKPPLKT